MALTKIGAGLFKDTLKTNVSGALGDNATLIRSLTEAGVSGSKDATGGNVTIQHHTDRIPSDVTVPSDAEIISTEEDGSPLMRRKLNPQYTSSLT